MSRGDTTVDVLVIGGGVIGLAVARAMAMSGSETIVVERAQQFGMETSSRNSEVIHAGIYYQPDSLKARFCIDGCRLLYAFCDSRSVPYQRCGKFIVANGQDQISALEAIRINAEQSGVTDLRWMDGDAVREVEPDILCEAALFSPSTGIIDSHAYLTALLTDAEAHGAILACHTEITAIRRAAGGWDVHIAGEIVPAITARRIVNCAGLWASDIAAMMEGMDAKHIPQTRYAKGCYFSYSGRTSFHHLIYPVPEPGGLGTHLTIDMSGSVRFGPDVEWVDALDYEVPPARRDTFLAAIRSFWPGVEPDRLHPAYAGIRPKIGKPGEAAADFRFSAPDEHGLPGVVHLYGIESPGLTASLAIANHVQAIFERDA